MQNKLQNDKNKILQEFKINIKVNENKDNLDQDYSVDHQSDTAEHEEDINIDKQSFLNYINKVKPDLDSIEQMLDFNTVSRYLPKFKTGKRLSMRKVIQWIASDQRKDRIWMHKFTPDARRWEIILLIDGSSSMEQ